MRLRASSNVLPFLSHFASFPQAFRLRRSPWSLQYERADLFVSQERTYTWIVLVSPAR